MPRVAFILLFYAIALARAPSHATAEESALVRTFTENVTAAEKAYADQRFEEAANRYATAVKIFPFEPTTRFRLACCLARSNRNHRAIEQLKQAIELGFADVDMLKQQADLEAIRSQPAFAELQTAAEAARDEEFVIHAGENAPRNKPAGVLVLLHGAGAGPRSEIAFWKPAADQLGLILVAPRAPNRRGTMLFAWQRKGAKDSTSPEFYDLEGARQAINRAMEEASRQYEIDPDKVILAGYSQGGGVALQLLATEPERFTGAVVVNSLSIPIDATRWKGVADGNARVRIIAGEYDKLMERSRTTAEALKAAGVAHELDVVRFCGHEMPLDSQSRLLDALQFVLSER